MVYFILGYLVCSAVAFFLIFRSFRSIKITAPLFTKEEIAAWNAKWLPGDLAISFIISLMGPIGLFVAVLVSFLAK